MSFFSSPKTWIFFLLVQAAVLGSVVVYSDKGLVHLSSLDQEEVKLRRENDKLREENRRLLLEIERVKNDPLYIEGEARSKLGLVRPDETIYRLAEEPDMTAGSGQDH